MSGKTVLIVGPPDIKLLDPEVYQRADRSIMLLGPDKEPELVAKLEKMALPSFSFSGGEGHLKNGYGKAKRRRRK